MVYLDGLFVWIIRGMRLYTCVRERERRSDILLTQTSLSSAPSSSPSPPASYFLSFLSFLSFPSSPSLPLPSSRSGLCRGHSLEVTVLVLIWFFTAFGTQIVKWVPLYLHGKQGNGTGTCVKRKRKGEREGERECYMCVYSL